MNIMAKLHADTEKGGEYGYVLMDSNSDCRPSNTVRHTITTSTKQK